MLGVERALVLVVLLTKQALAFRVQPHKWQQRAKGGARVVSHVPNGSTPPCTRVSLLEWVYSTSRGRPSVHPPPFKHPIHITSKLSWKVDRSHSPLEPTLHQLPGYIFFIYRFYTPNQVTNCQRPPRSWTKEHLWHSQNEFAMRDSFRWELTALSRTLQLPRGHTDPPWVVGDLQSLCTPRVQEI